MNIVITGTSRGIGAGLTRVIQAAGHQIIPIDRAVADLRSPEAAGKIAARVGASTTVDILINNAGILREGHAREDFMESFLVNTVAPFEVTSALLPNLKKSSNPRVVHITSKMGSITDNSSGGYYAYRSSKAALNMINKSLARDNHWLTTVVVHPGWVKTDMGGHQAPTQVYESAAGIWNLANRLTIDDSGRFFDFNGETIPW